MKPVAGVNAGPVGLDSGNTLIMELIAHDDARALANSLRRSGLLRGLLRVALATAQTRSTQKRRAYTDFPDYA